MSSADDIISVGFLEVQVWASRALIGAGFPGGAVDQAARLVTQSQLLDDRAIAGFVADLPVIGARDHGTPDLESGGIVNANGLHALAVAPGVLDMACAGGAGHVFRVRRSAGAWVLPGAVLHGARRGHAVLAATREATWIAWPNDGGPAVVRLTTIGESALPPDDGYTIAKTDGPSAAMLSEGWILRPRELEARIAKVQHQGFPVRRGTWSGVTDWGWKMLVPTSERSKAQAGGDMGET